MRLVSPRSRRSIAPHLDRGVRSLAAFLGKTNYAEEAVRLGIGARLDKARKLLDTVKLPEYLSTLRGTIGTQPIQPLTTGT